jgi:hypothetical protein
MLDMVLKLVPYVQAAGGEEKGNIVLSINMSHCSSKPYIFVRLLQAAWLRGDVELTWHNPNSDGAGEVFTTIVS